MSKKNSMKNLIQELEKLLQTGNFPKEITEQYLQRIKKGKLSIKENSLSHFCVYFATFYAETKEVFIGHHKKSGLWLFNGGHLDKDEMIEDAVKREMREEWDLDGKYFEIGDPEFLTITEIDNPKKQPCKRHYDLWCFIEVEKERFKPSDKALSEEFSEYGWKSFDEARKLVTQKNTLEAINFMEKELR
jgi:8-oxo-dGTP pyrophosphatase MutT (NUDIX family)